MLGAALMRHRVRAALGSPPCCRGRSRHQLSCARAASDSRRLAVRLDTIHSADNREQAPRGESLLHRPEAIGVPLAGHHQEAVGRQAEASKAGPIGMSEFERIPLPLAPEHHALVVRLAMDERGDQRQAEIPNRGLAAITVGHQLLQGGLGPATACKKRIELARIENGGRAGDRLGVADTTAFDPLDLSPEPGKASASL